MTPQQTERSDPRALLAALWRWKLLFLTLLVAAPVVSYLIVRNKPRVYESSTLISVSGATVNTAGGSAGGASFSTSNLAAIARLVNTTQIADIAAKLLNPPANPGAIAGGVSATGDVTTNFITITAQANDPGRAAAIANAFATALGTNRTNAALSEINTQIAALQNQLGATPPGPTTLSVRQQLNQQITQLRALRGSQGGNVSVIQPATANATPISPHVRRTVELGLVIGLLLAIGAVALAENSDRRIRGPADLEELTKLPLLSAVSRRAFAVPVNSVDQTEEAFQMLRSALTYFNIDRRLTTLVIVSAGEKEGKTTVAIRLAIAAARSGKSVILVDADLRRCGLTQRVGITTQTGLGAVLVGEVPLAQALVDHRIEMVRAGGKLTVLPAGPPPPNPSELLSSREMQRLLSQLETEADMVVVDTPAALAVSDTLPLLPEASGVVLVARVDRTRREAIRRVQGMVTAAHGTLLGVVATGTSGGPAYEPYSYGYGATPNGHRRGLAGRLRSRLPGGSRDAGSEFAAEAPKSSET